VERLRRVDVENAVTARSPAWIGLTWRAIYFVCVGDE